MPNSDSAIHLEHVSRYYTMGESSVRAVDDVSLSIPEGQFLALLGSSGSGKSTLLNLIAGLDRVTSSLRAIAATPSAWSSNRSIFFRA
jgi:putative ABC transport system ATP-binding protein